MSPKTRDDQRTLKKILKEHVRKVEKVRLFDDVLEDLIRMNVGGYTNRTRWRGLVRKGG